MLKDYEFWFVVGSQFLYGPEVLETVAQRAQDRSLLFCGENRLKQGRRKNGSRH